MNLAQIDYLSNSDVSVFHRMNPAAKMLFTVLMLSSVIISNELYKLILLIAVSGVLFAVARIPFKTVFHLVLYALIFSTLFAFIAARQSWELGLVVIFKAIGTALATIWLITTTSYVDVFSVFSLFMPQLLVDVFIFTYRSFFILIGKMEQLFKNIKLRGGYHPLSIITNLKSIAAIVGIFIIHSFEMSERMYNIYSLRGYNGSIPASVKIFPLKSEDIVITLFGVIILTGVVVI